MKIEELSQYGIDVKEFQYYLDKLHKDECVIAVTGEFSAGKSCFINCLLNKQDLLPYGTLECTPILIDIYEGPEDSIGLRYLDGSHEFVEYSKENIEKYARFDRDNIQNVLSMELPIQNMSLRKGVHIFDTPGTNTIHTEQEALTNYIIKKADLILYVFDKALGKSDIEHIMDIRKYSNNIIYIMTHADEMDAKTGEVYSTEAVNRLMEEAKGQISKGLGCERDALIILPIGSVCGFEDRTYPNEILASVNDYLDSRTYEKRKKNVKRQIASVIVDAVNNISVKRNLLLASKEKEEREINEQVEKFQADIEKAEKNYNKLVDGLEKQMMISEENCCVEFNHHLLEGKEKVSKLLQKDDTDAKAIEAELQNINVSISATVRNYLEKSVNGIMNKSYDEVRKELDGIISSFDVEIPVILEAPRIEELDNVRLRNELSKVNQQMEENVSLLQSMDFDSTDKEKASIKAKINKQEVDAEEQKNKLIELGAYKPVFKQKEIAGGGQSGKVVGRIIGEIADIALLLWNPAGAAAEGTKAVAEGAKAATEVAGAVVEGAKVAAEATEAVVEVAQVADKAKDAITMVKYVAEGIGKVDQKRRELVDKVEEKEKEEESGLTHITQMLDMLSIGYWAEKAGGFIGESIKPTKIIQEEDLETKNTYVNSRDAIIAEMNRLSSEIYRSKEELAELEDYGREKKLRKDIEEKQKLLEERKRLLEDEQAIEKENYKKRKESEYYTEELNKYYEELANNAKKLIISIYGEIRVKAIEEMTISYENKVKEFENMIAEMTKNKADQEIELNNCTSQIEALSKYENFIDEWLVV